MANKVIDFFQDYFDGSADKAIVMLVDSGFLPGVLMTLSSVIKTHSLKGASLVILTTDPVVAQTPLIKRVAAKIQLFDESDIQALSGVSRDHVKRGEKHHLVAKYTLFKFFFFHDFGFGDQFFLDADLIFLKNFDHLHETYEPRLMAAPALDHNDWMQASVEASLEAGIHPGADIINSGFMYAGQRFLRSDMQTVHSLIEIAEGAEFRKEQEIVSQYLADKSDVYTLPVSYNFLRSYMGRIGEDNTRALEEDLITVHYVQAKPWVREPEQITFADSYYFDVAGWLSDQFGEEYESLYGTLLDLAKQGQGGPGAP